MFCFTLFQDCVFLGMAWFSGVLSGDACPLRGDPASSWRKSPPTRRARFGGGTSVNCSAGVPPPGGGNDLLVGLLFCFFLLSSPCPLCVPPSLSLSFSPSPFLLSKPRCRKEWGEMRDERWERDEERWGEMRRDEERNELTVMSLLWWAYCNELNTMSFTRMSLLQWAYYNEFTTVSLLQWAYYKELATMSLLQWVHSSQLKTMILVQSANYNKLIKISLLH